MPSTCLVRAAHLSPAQVPTCCCLRTINIERFEQVEGGGGANEDSSGELAAIPYGKVQEQCNFDTTCCLSTKHRAMFETKTRSRACVSGHGAAGRRTGAEAGRSHIGALRASC